MKATYQQPTTNIYFVATTRMIAASQLVNFEVNGQDLSTAPTTNDTYGNLSRHRSVWDSDEEDDQLY